MNWFDESPGGMERMVKALVQTLPAQGVSVRALVAASEKVRASTLGVVTPFATPDMPMLKRILALRRSALQLRSERMPDVVAAHFVLYAAPILRMFNGVPKVIHFHGPWSEEAARENEHMLRVRIYRALEDYTYRHGTRYIVLSNAYGKILTRYGVDERTIRIVPGCVDVARFDIGVDRRTARDTLNLPQDRPIVLCVRRLVSRMGIEDLIDAIASVRQSVTDVLLVIAGKGPLASALQARIEERGLTDHVRMAGFVSEESLPTWYRAANMSIVPTVALEGFGLTTIESLASGTPVLVTPVGGLPEAVAPLSPDLVLERSGAEALGAALTDALLGRIALPDHTSCIRYARSRFDLDVVAAQIADVYREAIDHAS
ncbi:glycosyltransferase family 4 protein [Caballeronia terrestris]|nr:glycosyltransferase family 4 protein [Caballeronia terrestris]